MCPLVLIPSKIDAARRAASIPCNPGARGRLKGQNRDFLGQYSPPFFFPFGGPGVSPGGGLGAEPPAWWTTFSTKIKFQHRKTHFRVAKNAFHWADRFLRVGDCTSANGGVRAFIQKARPCAPTNQNEGQPSRNLIRDVRKATCWGGVLPWAVPAFSKNSK